MQKHNNKGVCCNVCDRTHNSNGCNCNLDKIEVTKQNGEHHFCKSYCKKP